MLGLFTVLIAGSIYLIPNLNFNYEFEQFFPRNNPDLDYYNTFRERFEPDDNYMLIAVENKAGVFEQDFLRQVHQLTAACARLPFVTSSMSLTNYPVLKAVAGYPYSSPAVHIEDTSSYQRDSLRAMGDDLIRNRFMSGDGKALSVLLKTDRTLTLGEAEMFSARLDDLLAGFRFDEVHLAGRSHYLRLFVINEKKEFIIYTTCAAILMTIVLIMLFRKLWGVLVAMASVLGGMVIFLGFLSAVNLTLDPMATLFPILMVLVAMSDVIHISAKYIAEQRRGLSRREAMRVTIREVGFATFLTAVVTAVGLLSLCTSSLVPIRNFGATAAIGVMIAFFVTLFFGTSLLLLFNHTQLARRERTGSFWTKSLTRLHGITQGKRRLIVVVAVGVSVVSIIGITRVGTDVTIDKQFPRADKVREDFRFFEERMGGVRPFEIAVTASGNITDEQVLREIARVDQHLRHTVQLAGVTSPATVYLNLNRAFNGDRAEEFRMPESSERFAFYKRIAQSAPRQLQNVLVSEDERYGRISCRFRDIGTLSSDSLRWEITSWINTNVDTSLVRFTHTGSSHLYDLSNNYVRGNMLSGIGLEFLVVSLLMGLLFRNFRMVLISLIPNILPIMVCGGLLGFLGIELSASVAIIFGMTFGIVTDDTIHFLTGYRIERAKGYKVEDAIRETMLETGKAICMTTMILFFGFIILLTSTYPNTVIIGLLVSITFVLALITDLFLTPVLVRAFMKERNLKPAT